MGGGHENKSVLLYGCDGSVRQTIGHSESVFLAAIQFIMILFAVYGNALVILAILRNKKLQIPRNSFLCSLALIDLLSPLVRVLPMALSTMKGKWLFGCTCCITLSATGVFFCSAAILHLCAITIERYITVSYPMKSRYWVTKRRTKLILFLIWLCALVMAILPHFSPAVHLYFNEAILVCDFYLAAHPELSLYMASLYYIVPVVLMVGIYFRIYRKIVVNNQVMTHHVDNSRRQADLNRRMKQEWKAVKMAIVIIGMFFILWLPYFAMKCVTSYHPNIVPRWTQRFAFICAYLNSCSNFIIYSIMNSRLREAFKEFIPCRGNTKSTVVKLVSFRVNIKSEPRDDELELQDDDAQSSSSPDHGVAVICSQRNQGFESDVGDRRNREDVSKK